MVPLHKVRFFIYIEPCFQLRDCLYYTIMYLTMVNIYNIWVNVWSEFAKSCSSINSEIIQTIFSLWSTFINIHMCVYMCVSPWFFPQLGCQLYPLSSYVKNTVTVIVNSPLLHIVIYPLKVFYNYFSVFQPSSVSDAFADFTPLCLLIKRRGQ